MYRDGRGTGLTAVTFILAVSAVSDAVADERPVNAFVSARELIPQTTPLVYTRTHTHTHTHTTRSNSERGCLVHFAHLPDTLLGQLSLASLRA